MTEQQENFEEQEAIEQQEEAQFLKNIHAYWANHEYHRMSVTEDILEFCGWQAINDLVTFKGNTEIEQAFLATLFLTGGRVQEVLSLTKENFTIHERKDGAKYFRVSKMPLEKRYKKIGEKFKGEDGKNHFHTEKSFEFRNNFSIMFKEPIAPILVNWIEKSKGGLLFPSPNKKKGICKKGERPRSRKWAYKFIRRLDKKVTKTLRYALGLATPQIVDRTAENQQGRQIADCLHLWLHWFRSQRASQLRHDYHWDIYGLMTYFSWKSISVAMRYLKEGAKDQADSMDTESYD